MKSKLSLFILCNFLFLLVSCNNQNYSKYSLTGDFYIQNQSNLKFESTEDFDVLNNVKLRRGDNFIITSPEDSLGFSSLENTSGFQIGDNNYIEVLNEGIYEIKIENKENPKVFLNKTDSSYNDVKLIFINEEKENLTFNKNSDYTFSLTNTNISYNDEFYIQMDDDIISYKDLSEDSSEFLSSKNTSIKSSSKGKADLKIDYNQDKVLSVKFSSLSEKNILPTDGESYKNLINGITTSYFNDATELQVSQKKVTETATTGKNYYETRHLNEAYSEEYDIVSEETIKNGRFYNDKNYYEIKEYINSKNKPTFMGKLLGSAPTESEDESSTIIKEKKDYITLEKANANINSYSCYINTLYSKLNSVIDIQNLQPGQYTYEDEDNYFNSIEILQAKYTSQYNDNVLVEAKNYEIYDNDKNSIVVECYVNFEINEFHQLTKGKILNTRYVGDVLDLTKLGDKTPESTTTVEFNIKYEGKTSTKDFSFDYQKYIISDITFIPTDFTCNQTFQVEDILHLNFTPNTAIDFSNLILIEYDSAFIHKNVVSGWRGVRSGTTEVTIGNTYSDLAFKVELNFNYAPLLSLEIKNSNYTTAYYEGGVYEFYVEVTSYADPVVRVSLSDTTGEYAVLEYVDSDEQMISSNKPTFRIHFLKAIDKLTITVQSKTYKSISTSLQIKVLPSLTISQVAGDYYYNSLTNTYIKLFADGTGLAQSDVGDNKLYNFTYTILGSKIFLLESEDLSVFTAEIELINEKYNLYTLRSISILDKNNQSIFSYNYARYNKLLPIFENTYVSDDGKAEIYFEFDESSFSSYSGIKAIAKLEVKQQYYSNYYSFEWSPYLSNEFSNLKVDGESIWSVNFNITDFSVDGFHLTISKASDNINLDFNFLKKE